MKHLKWLIALVALLVVPLIGSSTASAASCSNIGMSYTTWTGFLESTATLSGCTDVSATEQKRVVTSIAGCTAPKVSNGCATGWWDGDDNARGINPEHPTSTSFNLDDDVQNNGNAHSVVWRVQAWCGGGTHWIYTQFIYRIKRAATGTWGDWHYWRSVGYQIVC